MTGVQTCALPISRCGGRARPPQRVRSVSLKGFDSAVRRANHPRLAQRVRSCSRRKGFWSLRPLLRQFTLSVARLASLEGVNEPFAQATGSRLLLVFARGSSVCVLALSRGESTSRRSIVSCPGGGLGLLLRYRHRWSPELCAGCGRVGPGWTDGAASEYVPRPFDSVTAFFLARLRVLCLASYNYLAACNALASPGLKLTPPQRSISSHSDP